MSSIQLPGLSTGLDTSAIIQQLMQVERRRLTMFESGISQKKQIRTAVTELQSKLNTFKNKLNALSDAGSLRAYSATSSNSDKVTVQAGSGAHEGSHSVQVRQLATANRWVHDGLKYATSYVGAGTFILGYNHQELIIQTTDQTTLQDVVNLINNDPDNPGITAGILHHDDGSGNAYHLVLNGKDSGSDYQISIKNSNSEIHTAASTLRAGGVNAGLTTKISSLTDFSGQGINFLNVNAVDIAGTLHDGTAVNTSIAVNSYSTIEDLIREIEEAFGDTVKVTLEEGQLKITDKTEGASQMTLTLAFKTDTETAELSFEQIAAGGSINAGLAAFDVSTFIETQAAQNALVKVDDYPPGQDAWISRSANTIDDVISGVTLNLHGTTANADGGYDKLEVNLTRDTESLKRKMQEMMEAYNAVVMYFDEKTKYDPETNTSGILAREYTLTGIQSLLRTPLTANATGFTGADSFINPREIGLSFDGDGLLMLDEEKFAEAINKDYRGVLSLIGAQKTGSSGGPDAAYVKFYDSSTYTQAGAYDVRVEIDAEGAITSALIKRADEDWSQARQAEVMGNYIIGLGGDDQNNPERDLQLSIDTRQTGRTLEATISVRQGFAGAVYDAVNQVNHATTGRIAVSQKSIDAQIDNLNRRIENEQARLDRVEQRLVAKYARLESLLTSIQQQFSGLNML
ncbi:MAG TPA: hypothetical protein ENN97_06280 [Phycisphaerales bacterium]|nr:hypothetical protein [Phycisphaerales bacterium]